MSYSSRCTARRGLRQRAIRSPRAARPSSLAVTRSTTRFVFRTHSCGSVSNTWLHQPIRVRILDFSLVSVHLRFGIGLIKQTWCAIRVACRTNIGWSGQACSMRPHVHHSRGAVLHQPVEFQRVIAGLPDSCHEHNRAQRKQKHRNTAHHTLPPHHCLTSPAPSNNAGDSSPTHSMPTRAPQRVTPLPHRPHSTPHVVQSPTQTPSQIPPHIAPM